MVRTSFYDRISEKRLADEARARVEAQRLADAPPVIPEPDPVPVLPLQLTRNELKVAGLTLVMPQGVKFRDIDITLEKEGHPITLTVKRRPVHLELALERSASLYVENLHKIHPGINIVRQRDCLLAGSPAVALDFVYPSGQHLRHGRAINAIISAVDGNDRQWFSVSTAIDPDKAELAEWLIDFAAVLEAIVAH